MCQSVLRVYDKCSKLIRTWDPDSLNPDLTIQSVAYCIPQVQLLSLVGSVECWWDLCPLKPWRSVVGFDSWLLLSYRNLHVRRFGLPLLYGATSCELRQWLRIWVSFVMAASEMSVLSLCLAIIYGRKICPLVWFPSLWKNSAPNLARSSSTIYIWPMPIDMRHVFPRCWIDDPCMPAEVRNYSQRLSRKFDPE